MAIAAIISSLFISLLGIILAHISLYQIKQSGERGRGLAIAALVIGYLGLIASVIVTIIFLQTIGEVQNTYR